MSTLSAVRWGWCALGTKRTTRTCDCESSCDSVSGIDQSVNQSECEQSAGAEPVLHSVQQELKGDDCE